MNVDQLAASIADGCRLAIGNLSPMALVRALIARGATDLDLVGVPTAGLAADMLIGAGCVRSLETSGCDLGQFGFAPHFEREAGAGGLQVIDSTCPALLMALQAAASGISHTPVPGLLGSDLVEQRPDWRIVQDPYREPGCLTLLVPALRPDVAAIHGLRADPDGNVVTTVEWDDPLLVQASARAVATVERIDPHALDHLERDEQVIPGVHFDAVVEAPGGALPLGCDGRWPADAGAIQSYIERARGRAGVHA